MTLLQALGAIGLGSVVTALIGGLFLMRKNRSESGKLDADAAKIIADAAAGLVAPMSLQIGKLEKRVETLETDNERKSGLLESATRVIRDFLTCGAPNCPVVARAHTIPADLGIEVKK